MEVVDDDFFVVIIGDEDKQKQKSKEHETSKQLQSTQNNKEEVNEKANFTSALNLIDNDIQYGEVKTEPVEILEEGECLSIKSEPEEILQEDELDLQTDEKLESSTDDNLLIPISTKKRKRVVKANVGKPIKKNIMVKIPSGKKKKPRKCFRLKQEEWRSHIEELRQQFPELNEDEDLLVETLRGILGEVKAPPTPKEYFIMNDIMYE